MALLEGEQTNDRADITVRVFHMKPKKLLDDFQSGQIFGPIVLKKRITTCTYINMD
jgi:hypothetical protein